MRVFMMNDDKLIAVAMSCVRCVCASQSDGDTDVQRPADETGASVS